MRILIIEDNIATANYLCQGLKENYFIPEVAHDGQEGLFLAMVNQYDAIVLDVMLPHVDGWKLVKDFRKKKYDNPCIIFNCARCC